MIITISGFNASGKTRLAKMLAQALGYEHRSMGDITREHAKSLGLSISEHDEFMRAHPELDREFDQQMVNVARSLEHVIVDSRLGWYLFPESYKIFVKASEEVRAQRAYERQLAQEAYVSVAHAKKITAQRIATVRERLQKLYGVDVYDEKNFDLVVDTTIATPSQTLAEVISQLPQL